MEKEGLSQIIYIISAVALIFLSYYFDYMKKKKMSQNPPPPHTEEDDFDMPNLEDLFPPIDAPKKQSQPKVATQQVVMPKKKYESSFNKTPKETMKANIGYERLKSRLSSNIKVGETIELDQKNNSVNEIMQDFDPIKAVIYAEIINRKEH